MSDSAVVELTKVISSCQPYVQEVETNDNDVKIVAIICLAIVLVAFIAVCGFLCWKSKEIKAGEEERTFQKTKEEEECQRKIDANNKDRANKLVERYLEILKVQTESDKNGLKSIQYRKVLEYLIEIYQKGALNNISKDSLESLFGERYEKES